MNFKMPSTNPTMLSKIYFPSDQELQSSNREGSPSYRRCRCTSSETRTFCGFAFKHAVSVGITAPMPLIAFANRSNCLPRPKIHKQHQSYSLVCEFCAFLWLDTRFFWTTVGLYRFTAKYREATYRAIGVAQMLDIVQSSLLVESSLAQRIQCDAKKRL